MSLLEVDPLILTLANDNVGGEFAMSVVAQPETFLERFQRLALEVFSNEAKADRWLRCEIPALENKRPIDLITTPQGRDAVEAELIRIESGTY